MCMFNSKPSIPEPKQAPKAPEIQALVRRNTSGPVGPGKTSGSTMLTGAGGISDKQLLLGKNTLLGS